MSLPDNYIGLSPLYCGRAAPAGRPAWRTAMAANTWAVIPGNTLADIDPATDPAINPNYPAAPPWENGPDGLITPWCGASWDEANCKLHLSLQAGHTDGGDNAPRDVGLNADSATWVMRRYPSGAVGNVINLNDGQEATGLYSDGRLRAAHSYNNNFYLPGIGPMVGGTAGPYRSGAGAVKKAFKINETTGEATLWCDYSSFNAAASGGSRCYDSSTNEVFIMGPGTSAVVKIDVVTVVASQVKIQDNYCNNYLRMVPILGTNLLAVIHDGGVGYKEKFFLLDKSASMALIEPAISGSFAAGLSLHGKMGMDWDATNGRLLLWDDATDTRQISTLTPPTNPRTQPWVAGVLTVSGSNAVTPTAKTPNGTFGRFGYSATLGGCYLLNGASQQIHFFATE